MDNRETILSVKNLTKKFGDLLVLDEVSFDVKKHEFLCVVGPTGCGKTTFLNSVTKLYEPSAGEILLNGRPVDLSRDNVSYIFQEPSSMEWLNVEENVGFGLDIKGIRGAEKQKAVDEVLEMVGLSEFRKYYPNEISASMLQRVVIARAFATKPDLLLMDEPYGQLDIELRYKLEDELIRIWQQSETTVIFITHNIEEAVYMSENILVLTNKPAKIKARVPNNLPRPRNVVDRDFVALRNEITELIKWW